MKIKQIKVETFLQSVPIKYYGRTVYWLKKWDEQMKRDAFYDADVLNNALEYAKKDIDS